MDKKKYLKKITDTVDFAAPIAESKVAKVTEWINTGNYMLNAIISGSLLGGVPSNKSLAFAGVSGCGKTFMCLNIAREAQKLGYTPVYLDTEGAIDVGSVENFGIDTENFWHVPVSDIVKLKEVVTNLIKDLLEEKRKNKEIPKFILFLDSLGMLASSKELNDALEGKDKRDMTKAQMVRSFFRLVTADLTGLGIPLIITNHIVTDIGMFPKFTMSGGLGIVYATSSIISMTKGKLKDSKEDKKMQTGVVTLVKSEKNRFARPGMSAHIHIHFKKGFNAFLGLQKYISWENCGIEKGNILSQRDYEKLKPAEQEKCYPMLEQIEKTIYDDEGNELIDIQTKDAWFSPKKTARNYVIKHLGKTVPGADLFTEEVFTKEVLIELDEKVIKPLFSFKSNDEDLNSFFDEENYEHDDE